ncbi:hypothetical protein ILYODFUR_007494, partial [Ilyodon furcidens]
LDVATEAPSESRKQRINGGAPDAITSLYLRNFNPICAYLLTCVTAIREYVCSVSLCIMAVFLCVLGAQCNHSSNLSARILCVGDIKVLISTVTQHQCHCEDTSNTSTAPKSSVAIVCVCVLACVCVCVCVCEGGRL